MYRFIGTLRDRPFMAGSISRRGTVFIQCLPPICNRLTMFCLTIYICFLSLFLCLFHTFFKITGRFCKLFFSLHHCILSSSRQIMHLLLTIVYICTDLIFRTIHFTCYLTYFLAQSCWFCIVI